MARARRSAPQKGSDQLSKLTSEDLIYLAGIFESALQGMRALGTGFAAYASPNEDWPKYMAKTYCGEAKEYTANRTGKTFWGWYLSLEDRFKLIKTIERAGVARATGPIELDGILYKIWKRIDLDRRQVLEGEGYGR